MTYLWISRILFWSFLVIILTASLIWLRHVERLDRQQEEMAEAHRRRRRIERFNDINR
jgi:cytochrome b561